MPVSLLEGHLALHYSASWVSVPLPRLSLASSPGPSHCCTNRERAGKQRHTFYVIFNERRRSEPQPAFQNHVPTPNIETSCSVLLTSKCNITLQTNVFIASDEIHVVPATHFHVQYHIADEQVYRYSNQQTRFVLETSIFGAGHEHVSRWRWTLQCWRLTHSKCMFELQSHTHSQLPATFKQNLCRAHLWKPPLSRWGDPKVM